MSRAFFGTCFAVLLLTLARTDVAAQVSSNAIGYPLWPGGAIPYRVDESFVRHAALVDSVLQRWATRTPLRFFPAGSDHKRFLLIERGGCGTDVHAEDRAVRVRARPDCLGHEVGHGIGLLHEHQRPDRDTYVSVNFPFWWLGFGRSQYDIISQTLCRPYDVNSLMHYYDNDRIVPKAGVTLGTVDNMPTEADLQSVRQLYGMESCVPQKGHRVQ